MMRIGARLIAILLVIPTTSSAHRLDEYLQATRVSVARDRIELQLDLTPGASVASVIAALIDRDRDGWIAPSEARTYGTTVLSEIVLTLNGRVLPLTLNEVRVPAIALMREGMGAVRIEASAVVGDHATGRHDLFFRNDHRPHSSVYLVNAMMPATRAVTIESQHRDTRQREFHLVYEVERNRAAIDWTIAAALLLGALTVSRRRVNASSQSAG